jgi:hypothetical protein
MSQSNHIELYQTESLDQVDANGATGQSSPVELMPPPGAEPYDVLAELEEILVKMRVEERGRAREENQIEEQRIQEQGQRHVEAIRDRADAMLAKGILVGVTQVGAGVLGAYGGFEAEAGYEALGKAVGGAGELGGAVCDFGASGAEARMAQTETAQATAERRANQATSDMQDAKEDLRALLSALQRLYDVELAAKNAAIFAV